MLNNLKDGSRLNIARVEFYPADPKDLATPSKYKLHIDEDRTPEWFTQEMQDRTAEIMRLWIKAMIIEGDVALLVGGPYILKAGAKVECTKHVLIHAMLESSVVNEMRESSVVNEMRESSVVNEMWESSVVKQMLGSSVVKQMLGSSVVNEMWESSVVNEMRESSVVKQMRESSVVNEMRESSVVKQMRGSSVVNEMWESSVVNEMRESSVVPSNKNPDKDLRPKK